MLQISLLKYGIKNLKEVLNLNDIIINDDHWYILSLKAGVPRLHPRYFKSKSEVKHFMKINNIKGMAYIPINGKKAKDYGLKLYFGNTHKLARKGINNYDYPPDKIDVQDKKSFRTKSRRWKRDYKALPTNVTDFKAFKNELHN